MSDIPVFSVQKADSSDQPKLLHRNMLLPFYGIYGIHVHEESDKADASRKQTKVIEEEPEQSTESESNSDEEERKEPAPVPRYVIPAKKGHQGRD